jgi:hypothetical protein
MKINFSNESQTEDSRYWISDACTSSYVDEADITLPDDKIVSMYDVAKKYAETYDHNGTDDEFAVCNIEDLVDGESIDFAFDGHGHFEWETSRQG